MHARLGPNAEKPPLGKQERNGTERRGRGGGLEARPHTPRHIHGLGTGASPPFPASPGISAKSTLEPPWCEILVCSERMKALARTCRSLQTPANACMHACAQRPFSVVVSQIMQRNSGRLCAQLAYEHVCANACNEPFRNTPGTQRRACVGGSSSSEAQ